MKKIKVTLAQISKQKNLSKIEKIIKEKRKSDLIIFPEAVLKTNLLRITKTLRDLVEKYSTRIIIGIVYGKKKKLYDYAYYISPERIERYQKIHVHWTEKYIPGRRFKIIKTPFGKIGMLICYDSSFQESGRILALKGAEMIVILSKIPSDFSSKINLMRSQSIALNNQVYVIESCKPGKKFTGYSSIHDPYGIKIIQLGKYESIKTKIINLDLIKKWRKKEKIFPYRKPSLYKKIISKKRDY